MPDIDIVAYLYSGARSILLMPHFHPCRRVYMCIVQVYEYAMQTLVLQRCGMLTYCTLLERDHVQYSYFLNVYISHKNAV